mmetsp:Transcript_3633/g.7361  ORF Transcript_3633/g.7361 Transcript_3633/m.7361 type:complete len:631 (-) Transcript_3633:223-2115(-)
MPADLAASAIKGLIHTWNPERNDWDVRHLKVIVAEKPFKVEPDQVMYHIREVRKTLGPSSVYIGKEFLNSTTSVHFDTCKTTTFAQECAKDFNKLIKTVAVLLHDVSVLELVDTGRCFTLLPVIPESQHELDEEAAKTKHHLLESFTHFSWEASGRKLAIMDLERSGEGYLNPTVHSCIGAGMQKVAEFLTHHKCKKWCRELGLKKLIVEEVDAFRKTDPSKLIYDSGRWEVSAVFTRRIAISDGHMEPESEEDEDERRSRPTLRSAVLTKLTEIKLRSKIGQKHSHSSQGGEGGPDIGSSILPTDLPARRRALHAGASRMRAQGDPLFSQSNSGSNSSTPVASPTAALAPGRVGQRPHTSSGRAGTPNSNRRNSSSSPAPEFMRGSSSDRESIASSTSRKGSLSPLGALGAVLQRSGSPNPSPYLRFASNARMQQVMSNDDAMASPKLLSPPSSGGETPFSLMSSLKNSPWRSPDPSPHRSGSSRSLTPKASAATPWADVSPPSPPESNLPFTSIRSAAGGWNGSERRGNSLSPMRTRAAAAPPAGLFSQKKEGNARVDLVSGGVTNELSRRAESESPVRHSTPTRRSRLDPRHHGEEADDEDSLVARSLMGSSKARHRKESRTRKANV